MAHVLITWYGDSPGASYIPVTSTTLVVDDPLARDGAAQRTVEDLANGRRSFVLGYYIGGCCGK